MRPFRFGVQLPGARTGKDWREKARRAEDLGYSALLMPDHLDTQWGPLVGMTIAAEATTTLRVGSLTMANDYRHPAVLAKEIATLDLASEGRLEFGLGAGWARRDYEAVGIPFDRAGVRVDRLAESIGVLKQMWSTAACRHAGEHYTITARQAMPEPATRPHPTLMVGGGGERVLRLAAREADIVGFNPRMGRGTTLSESGPDALTERVGWVRESAGERFDGLELQCMALFCRVTEHPGSSARAYAKRTGLTEEELLEQPLVLIGSPERIADTLRERRERWGVHYWVVHEQEMDRFAEVVAALRDT